MITRATVTFGVGLGFAAIGAFAQNSTNGAPGLVLPGGDDVMWGSVAERYRSVFVEFTPPAPIDRVALPWEPQQAVILALPLTDITEGLPFARIYRDILAALLPHVEVIGLYNRLDHSLLGQWLSTLEQDDAIAPFLARLDLTACEAYSPWVRDFGPTFGYAADGRLIVLDASFLDPQSAMANLASVKARFDPIQQHLSMVRQTKELDGIRGSDWVPAAIAARLQSRWDTPSILVRPPITLAGGDFLVVDSKNALISEATLVANGGNVAGLGEVFRRYYGVDRVHVLENLPGQSIEHLDFIVQPIGEGVMVVSAAPEAFGEDRAFHRLLNREMVRRLAHNAERLRRNFPKSRIVEVPMPPPILDSEKTIVDELFIRSIEMLSERTGLPFAYDSEGSGELADRLRMDDRLRLRLYTESETSNWQREADRRKAVEFYFGDTMRNLVARHVETRVRYRSYVNSLFIRNSAGYEIVLLPRYRPLNDQEAAHFPQLEAEVERAYREACPRASLVWIDCSELAGFLGVIHCLTNTVPVLAPSR